MTIISREALTDELVETVRSTKPILAPNALTIIISISRNHSAYYADSFINTIARNLWTTLTGVGVFPP